MSSWYLDGLTVVASFTLTVNLLIEYCDQSVTLLGGIVVMQRFLECAVVQLPLTKHAKLTKVC